MESKKRKFKAEHWMIVSVLLMLYDFAAVILSYFGALWLRFDMKFSLIPPEYMRTFNCTILLYGVICIIVFKAARLYNSIWKFAGYSELLRVAVSTLITLAVQIILTVPFFGRMPVVYYFCGALMQFVFVLGVRFAYRVVLLMRNKTGGDRYTSKVMLIGAGSAGQMILKDVQNSKSLNDKVMCIIDDDPNKHRRFINGVQVVGGRDEILKYCEKYDIEKIYIAIPSSTAEEKRDILNICKETNCELKVLPSFIQLINEEVTVSKMKSVAIEDLLGREQIKVDMTEIFEFLSGKTILVTGGGGSIGSELCRQIASHDPKKLIIFDVYENNAYDIQQELKSKHPELDLEVLIGSVRDSRRICSVFEEYRPDIVYHAAAHKHVPLMEDSPCEAIKNNAIGTYKTAYAAMMYGCKRFVLISTDKAVNPTNIMGASKRLCEMIIQTFDKVIKSGKADKLPRLFAHSIDENGSVNRFEFTEKPRTEYVAVRFGNVLGSNGSVIPLFKKQILKGGPVTVTHPDIIRYFMTIPEAVGLVLQAGTYAKGGEIFVLDMGSPVKIDMLARNLIRLSGYKPDVDIKIEYTGLRPGEKLYEEKLMAEEGMKKTQNKLIHIGNPIPFDSEKFISQLEELMYKANDNSSNIKELVSEIVCTYHMQDRTALNV